jgi:integrase
VRQRKEEGGRKRFLSREEYDKLLASILELFPEHPDDFIVSVYSGMRPSEQYTVDWTQVSLDQETIELTKTKNGMQRTVYLKDDALAALRRLNAKPHRNRDRVFHLSGETMTTKDWFVPCLADAEIVDHTWHCNRHTFCSWLAMAGRRSKRFKKPPVTRRSAFRRSIATSCHRISNQSFRSFLPHRRRGNDELLSQVLPWPRSVTA